MAKGVFDFLGEGLRMGVVGYELDGRWLCFGTGEWRVVRTWNGVEM